MKKNYFASSLLISTLSLSACAQTQNWAGTYTYEAYVGENSAEDKILIEYVLTLDKDKCLITSQGYQTDEKIICTTETNDHNLIVKFKSFANGSTKNIYDVEAYAPNSKLFTLTSNNSTLITTWEGLAPDESFTSGEHFKKSK